MLTLTCYAAPPGSLALDLPLQAVAACFPAGGFIVELHFVYWPSALQRQIPPEVLGKTLALDQLSAFALLPVGYALSGPVVAVAGVRPTLIVTAILTTAASAAALPLPGVSPFSDLARPERPGS